MNHKPLLAAVVLAVTSVPLVLFVIWGAYELGVPAYVASGISILLCLTLGRCVPPYMKWWNKIWEQK